MKSHRISKDWNRIKHVSNQLQLDKIAKKIVMFRNYEIQFQPSNLGISEKRKIASHALWDMWVQIFKKAKTVS